jgi:hypothetical protein
MAHISTTAIVEKCSICMRITCHPKKRKGVSRCFPLTCLQVGTATGVAFTKTPLQANYYSEPSFVTLNLCNSMNEQLPYVQ